MMFAKLVVRAEPVEHNGENMDKTKLDPEVIEYIEALEQDNKILETAMADMREAMEQLTYKVNLYTVSTALLKKEEPYGS